MDSALHRCRVRCGRPIETFFKALTIVTLPRQKFSWFRHVEVLQKTSSAGLFFFLKDMALQLRAMHKSKRVQARPNHLEVRGKVNFFPGFGFDPVKATLQSDPLWEVFEMINFEWLLPSWLSN